MKAETSTTCPHCESKLRQWANPQMSTWGGEFQLVCFNDECPYFVRGWQWMKQSYNVDASYRYRIDPETGEFGALAVWSWDALRSGILPDKEEADAGRDPD